MMKQISPIRSKVKKRPFVEGGELGAYLLD